MTIDFKLSYAYVPLCKDTKEQHEFLRMGLPLSDLRLTSKERGYPDAGLLSITRPERYPSRPDLRIGDLWYPTGAIRWAEAHYVITNDQYDDIVPLAFPNGDPTPQSLTLDQNNVQVSTFMYALPPRPLAKVEGLSGLYLLSLVDERYYWQFVKGTPAKTDTWTNLINSLASLLGISLSFSTPSSNYGKPQINSAWQAQFENCAQMLDAALANVGLTLVRNYNGTYSVLSATASEAIQNANRDSVRVAGGSFLDTLLTDGAANLTYNSIVPTGVSVSYPKCYATGNWINPQINYIPYCIVTGDRYVLNVTAASAGFANIVGYPYTLTLTDYAEAIFTASGSTSPNNLTELNALSVQLATDYYNSQVLTGECETYPLVLDWTPEGLNDLTFKWAIDRIHTFVQRKPYNYNFDSFLHHFSDAPGNTSVYGPGNLPSLSIGDKINGSLPWGILQNNDENELTEILPGSAGTSLVSNGTKATFTQVSLTTGVTGTLPIPNGGTNATTSNSAFNNLVPSQTSNSGKYLTTDGSNTSWGTVTVPSGANPTSTIGLSTVNGSALTFMRSDAAPPLSQAIVPTWIGAHTWTSTATPITITQSVATTGSPTCLTLTGGAHTTLTASTEDIDVNINLARTVQFSTGALTTQRAYLIQAPTYSFVGTSTITTAATFAVSGAPTASTNATITNNYSILSQGGTVGIRQAGGTAGTSEGQLLHDGTSFLVRSGGAKTEIGTTSSGTGQTITLRCRDGVYSFTDGTGSGFTVSYTGTGRCIISSELRLSSNVQLGWSSNTVVSSAAADTAMIRSTAAVVSLNDANTTGNPALLFQAKSTTTNLRSRAQFNTSAVDNTDATRKYRGILSAWDTAEREAIRFEGTGSAAAIGFFGTTAVVQQTGDAGTALSTLGLMSGTPTFAIANLSGAGTGVLTALGSAVTGSGGIVLATSPTLVSPALGTPSSGNLANCTNYPITSDFATTTGTTVAQPNQNGHTVGGINQSFLVSANVNVTAVTLCSFTVFCTYTDETNTSQTLTLSFSQVGGTILNTITNATGTGPYEGIPMHIRCKSGTTITLGTAGTFTSVTYNIDTRIIPI